MNWIVTLPKFVKWEDYQEELKAVKDGTQALNYKVRYIPKEMKVGDQLWITHEGKVRGWMTVTGLLRASSDWECTTTGKVWRVGNYIQRSGEFHHVTGQKAKGFRGIRKFNPEMEGAA